MEHRYGKVALVTGASSGIGREIAVALSQAGYRVYGASRSRAETPLEPGNLLGFIKRIRMDVTDAASVEAAVAQVLEAEGGIGVLINCAGNGIAGAVEDTTAEEAAAQFDVNVFGALRVTRAVLPAMRRAGRGIVINIGSVAGRISIPYQAMYSASKAALASMTSALRIEMKPFGVKAVMVEPGDTKTGFTDARTYTAAAKVNPAYRDRFERALYAMVRDEVGGLPPGSVAVEVLRCLRRKNPPARCAVGLQYKILCGLAKLLPLKLENAVVGGMYSGRLPDNALWTFEKNVLGGNGE